MATSLRQSVATPASGRQPSATPGPSGRGRNETPAYEAPTFALNAEAQRALANIARKVKLDELSRDIDKAMAELTNSAAEIYDDLLPQEERLNRVRAKQQRATQPDEGEGPADDFVASLEARVEEMRKKAENHTERMEVEMRKLIDCQQSVGFMQKGLEISENDARANASTQASTQARQSQRERRSGRPVYEGDDADEVSDNELPEFTPTDPVGGTQPQRATKYVFAEYVSNAQTHYQGIDHGDRYANNNAYRTFKRTLHDAQHPDDDVPMADPTTWFQEGGVPAPGVAQRTGGDEDDDDIVIMRGAISTKCPITLGELKDPLMSMKCPHVYEKYAIYQFIGRSETRPKACQCPVPGCSQMLEKKDLQVDNVLLRKIQRMQRSKELQEERENESGEDAPNGTQRRGLTIDDDDDEEGVNIDDMEDETPAPRARVKSEPRLTGASRASASASAPPRPSQVVDLGSDDEDEDMDYD